MSNLFEVELPLVIGPAMPLRTYVPDVRDASKNSRIAFAALYGGSTIHDLDVIHSGLR